MNRSALLCCALLSLLASCEEAKLQSDSSNEKGSSGLVFPAVSSSTPESRLSYPFLRTLTDKQGREVEAQILGRTATSVGIIRWSDKRKFSLPLTSLAPTDRAFLSSLPIFVPPKAVEKQTAPSRSSSNREDSLEYSIDLPGGNFELRRIDEIFKEIEETKEELDGIPKDSMRYKSIVNRVVGLKEDMTDTFENLILRTQDQLAVMDPGTAEHAKLSQALADINRHENRLNLKFRSMGIRKKF